MPDVFFITGCSSGFGEALAKDALQRGYRVIATARRPGSIDHLRALGAAIMPLDVTAPDPVVQECARRALEIYGRIDYLINNAGIALIGNLEEFLDADCQRIFETNVFGLMRVTRAFLPHFRAAKKGCIVNISSESMYAATKGAVDIYTDCLGAQLAPFGIRAVTVNPGEFDTSIGSNMQQVDVSQRIGAYASTAISDDERMAGKHPGTAEAAASRMLDVVTLTGEAEGRTLPSRFYLGEDSLLHVNNFLKRRLAETESWKDLAVGPGLAKAPDGERFL